MIQSGQELVLPGALGAGSDMKASYGISRVNSG